MQLNLNAQLDNAAFQDGEAGTLDRGAVADLLRITAGRLEEGQNDGMLIDVNGNAVGGWEIVKDGERHA